jgi:hypothetical protein
MKSLSVKVRENLSSFAIHDDLSSSEDKLQNLRKRKYCSENSGPSSSRTGVVGGGKTKNTPDDGAETKARRSLNSTEFFEYVKFLPPLPPKFIL